MRKISHCTVKKIKFYTVKSMNYRQTAHDGMVLAETHKTIISRAYLKQTLFRTCFKSLFYK